MRWWLLVLGLLTIAFHPGRFVLGSVLVIAGTALHFVSKGYLRQRKALTVAGPYRFTRNPFYLANLISEAGLLLIIGNWWVAGLYCAVWAFVYLDTIAAEERFLLGRFGEEYESYCKKVGRLVPLPWKVLPWAEVRGPRFSLKNPNILGGAEIERCLRLLSYPLLLYAAAAMHGQGVPEALPGYSPALLAAIAFLTTHGLGHLTTLVLRRRHPRGRKLTPEVQGKYPIPGQAA